LTLFLDNKTAYKADTISESESLT